MKSYHRDEISFWLQPHQYHYFFSMSTHIPSFISAWESASGEKMEEWGLSPEEFVSSRLEPGRPSFDSLMMRLAHLISTRSIDPSTKHGAVIVDRQSRILSMGYNGSVQGLGHDKIVWTRPEKYDYMIHAEANAILFAKQDLKGCTIYVTGPSCADCFNLIAQAGIKRCVFGPRIARCVTPHAQKVMNEVAGAKRIEIVSFVSLGVSGGSKSHVASTAAEDTSQEVVSTQEVPSATENPTGGDVKSATETPNEDLPCKDVGVEETKAGESQPSGVTSPPGSAEPPSETKPVQLEETPSGMSKLKPQIKI
jgi:dCMP deaminase